MSTNSSLKKPIWCVILVNISSVSRPVLASCDYWYMRFHRYQTTQ